MMVEPSIRKYICVWGVVLCFVLNNHLMIVSCQILSCVGDGACRCTSNDGGVLDISSLGNQDGTARFPDALSYDGKSYSFNPCFSFSTTGCSDAAICERDPSGSSYNRIASQKNSEWSFSGFYPLLTYTSSDGKKTEVSMICDPTFITPQLDVFGEIIPGVVSINLWSNCACPDTCKRVGPSGSSVEGLTAGSVMLIVFFSVVIVYLLAGAVFNYNRQREVSRSLVPNIAFWAALPGLIKDGTKFTWAKLRGRETTGIYQSADNNI